MADVDLNIPSDPEELAKLFAEAEGDEVKTDPPPEEPKETKSAAPEPEAEPEGIATKDGKHVIPYAVLKSERDKATRSEQLAKEMQDRVAALEAILAATGAKNGESARTEPEPTVSDADLEVLKEDFPSVYKTLTAAMQKVAALESKLQPVEQTVRNAEAEQQRTAAEAVQDAIDAVPKLAHIQATNAEAFATAQQFDAVLRQQTAWADRPLAERFAKVAEMLEAALGPIAIPGQATSPTAAELKATAKAKAEAVLKKAQGTVPNSLSEFPVGQHAAQDEQEEATNLTPLQLADKFARMTPDQMEAYFQTL